MMPHLGIFDVIVEKMCARCFVKYQGARSSKYCEQCRGIVEAEKTAARNKRQQDRRRRKRHESI